MIAFGNHPLKIPADARRKTKRSGIGMRKERSSRSAVELLPAIRMNCRNSWRRYGGKYMSVSGIHLVSWFVCVICLLGGLSAAFPAVAGDLREKPDIGDDTMLMFVGEDLEVLTIASRREESARQAPAVAQVVTRRQFQQAGADSLAKVLEGLPGFHMAPKEWGTRPYLRGIPDSVLLLHDTAPLSSDISKSFHPLDEDLSLAGVKRIEIVRGPGSVLWGPDAFAGIVNVVPMTGKDFSGIETGLDYGEPGFQRGGYLNMGRDGGPWNGFLSISGQAGEADDSLCRVTRFWGDGDTPVPPEDRIGSDRPDEARHVEAVGNIAVEDWLTLSGRIADSRGEYALRSEDELSWCEGRDYRTGMLKAEARKTLNHLSSLRWTGYLSRLDIDHQIIDRTLTQRETTFYTELIHDRALWSGDGLLTGGVSYREKHVADALVWEGYFPDYLKPDNAFLLPLVAEVDYDTRLMSVFGQYNHRVADFHLWIGLRYDDHDAYEDRLSYNAGLSWSPSNAWIVKLIYGTAYRTPFAKQLRDEDRLELEYIESLNLQFAWTPSERVSFGVCGFWNRLRDHVMEDPYAGLSSPNRQDIKGLELEGRYLPIPSLALSANLTLMDNSGPDEAFRLLVGTFVDADGNVVKIYEDLDNPYDSGPLALANVAAEWKPTPGFVGRLELGYTSSRHLVFPRGEGDAATSDIWLLDASATFEDLPGIGGDVTVTVRNALDHRYDTPGTYAFMEGDPASVRIMFRKKW